MRRCDSLLFKDDLADAKERLDYWWNCAVKDRIAALVTSPREKPIELESVSVAPPQILLPEQHWTSFDHRLFAGQRRLRGTWFGGEAIPCLECDLGVGNLALYLGATPIFQPEHETIWHEPVHDLYDNPAVLDNWQDSKWWRTATELLRKAVAWAEGKCYVPIPNLHEGLDTLASLRGSQDLLMDLVNRPDDVHACLRKITSIWIKCYDLCYAMVRDADGGSIFAAHNTWAPGRHAKIQCDFSAMISPRMFEEFVLPYLSEQCSRVDYTWYHMDGPGEIRHLDLLLAMPNLRGIQWSPGAGNPWTDSEEWIPMYRKIQGAGKCLFIDWLDPKNVLRIAGQLSPRGLLVGTRCGSEKEAMELLNRLRT